MKCIICGATDGKTRVLPPPAVETCGETNIFTYKLPHGSIHLCGSGQCRKLLTLQINDFASPMVWVSKDDLYEETDIDTLSKEEAENLTPEDLIEITTDAADMMWNGSFGEEYREILDNSAKQWRENKEGELVQNTPEEELPLLIGNLKYDRSKEYLEQRLRG